MTTVMAMTMVIVLVMSDERWRLRRIRPWVRDPSALRVRG
jgi:hypothetical protein